MAYFFRDPERQVPQDPDIVVSPADGRVMVRGTGRSRAGRRPATGSRSRSSCRRWTSTSTARRSAAACTRIEYRPGKFLPAYNEGSNDNELNEVWIDHNGRTVVFRQVVGMLARRIVCRVSEGDWLERGERIGLMKFGSRMDVFLPPDAELLRRGRRACHRRRDRARQDPERRCSIAFRCGAGGDDRPHRFRRGVFLLPSLFTVANLFCGYACVVYSTRADFDTAALFIGIAMVLDTLDGFFARLTNSSTAFGVELDSLADVVSFGLAPAILAFTWGLWPLGRLGWAAGFLYVTAAAMRLARFNMQTKATAVSDKRYFVGHAESGRGRRDCVDGLPLSRRAGGSARRAACARDGAGPRLPDGEHDPLPQREGDRRRLAAVVFRALHRRRQASHSLPRIRASRWW